MANGSRRWFGYTADSGDVFNVELDESIAETTALGFVGASPANPIIYATGRRPFALRYVNCYRVTADGETVRNKFYVGTAAALAAIANVGTLSVDSVAWNVTSAIGENRAVVPATDSGRLDGDVDNNFAV